MGLTVFFKLIAPPDTDAEGARALVLAMRRRAQGFKRRGRVDDVLPIGGDEEALRRATQYKSVPHRSKPGFASGVEIRAEEGCLFPVSVGEDCEALWLGLCRYPKSVSQPGHRFRTNLPGWRFSGFSKTQYASLHGWEHFRRCHTAVVDLLSGMRGMGLEVEINDEGGFWPGRCVAALRRNVEELNGIVAATAGALTDLDEAANGQRRAQSPIFAHKHFERLEAEGAARVGPALEKLREVVRKA